VADAVFLAGAARAEPPCGDADGPGAQAGYPAGGGCLEGALAVGGPGQGGVRVAVLGLDHPLEGVERAAAGDRLLRVGIDAR